MAGKTYKETWVFPNLNYADHHRNLVQHMQPVMLSWALQAQVTEHNCIVGDKWPMLSETSSATRESGIEMNSWQNCRYTDIYPPLEIQPKNQGQVFLARKGFKKQW